MTAIYLAWMAEIVLECIGSFLYRKRSPLLSILLGFCAFTDFAAVPFAQNYPNLIHGCLGWAQCSVKELMLIWLACSICGMFVSENRKSITVISAAFLSLASAAIIAVFSFAGETLKDKLLDGEIAANMILLGFVAVGWISRRDRLKGNWQWIVAGFMVLVGSDLIFTILWAGMPEIRISSHVLMPAWEWTGARHWYPLGAISAYLIWCIGPLRSVRLTEFRQSLDKKFPAVEEMRIM